LSCPFCAARVFFDTAHAVLHRIVEPRLDAAGAAAALRRWLKDREVVGRIAPSSCDLVFFPLWQVSSTGRTRIVPAAGALFDGLERIEVPAGDQKAFAPSRATDARGHPARVVDATVPLEAALARASARGLDLGTPGRLLQNTGRAKRVADASARLIHVPLFIVNYSLHGVAYRAAVDATSGHIYPITAPRSSEGRLDVVFGGLLASGLAANLIAFSFLKAAPLLSAILLATVSGGVYLLGMKLARWMES
jgi:hypothetical protein